MILFCANKKIRTTAAIERVLREPISDKCRCEFIECICDEIKSHKPNCKYILSLSCAIPIECEHGYDVCHQCDPCDCEDDPIHNFKKRRTA